MPAGIAAYFLANRLLPTGLEARADWEVRCFFAAWALAAIAAGDLGRYARLAGRGLDGAVIDDLSRMGLVQTDGVRLAATSAGRPVLNSILRALA